MERLLINRDISWLAFNKRVLDEAADRGNPLLERLNFIAIYSSNADEFCMVRFAGMLRHSDADSATESTRELCAAVKRELNSLARRQHHLLYDEILPELESRGIRIANRDNLSEEQRRTARSIMEQRIYPVLSPIAVDPSHPFPLVPNLVPQLLVRLVPEGREEEFFALLSIPPGLPRFIELSSADGGTDYLPTEELIRHRLPLLFAGADIRECAAFRITRDSDLSLDEEGISDLFSELKSALHRTRKRDIVRVEYESSMSRSARRWLLKQLKPHPDALLCPIRGLLNLKSLFQSTVPCCSTTLSTALPPSSPCSTARRATRRCSPSSRRSTASAATRPSSTPSCAPRAAASKCWCWWSSRRASTKPTT